MKIKIGIIILLATFILASCASLAKVVPPESVAPISTSSPASPIPAITLTPVFEILPDVKDLSLWVDNYVQDYEGGITINGVSVDINQYPTAKLVSSSSLSFLPLANCDQGIYLYTDHTYLTKDKKTQVDKWYRLHGWEDFIIKGNPFGLYRHTDQNLAKINIGSMQRVNYNAIINSTIINYDIQIFICPDN